MELFLPYISQIRDITSKFPDGNQIRVHKADWPRTDHGNLVLGQDTAIELGGSSKLSFEAIIWTEDDSLIRDDVITYYGKDLNELYEGSTTELSYGKLVLISAKMPDDVYPAFEKLDVIRNRQNLDGYMLRATSQRNREWCRISRKALSKGMSFSVIGSELIADLKKYDYVHKAEVMFFTSDDQVKLLKPTCDKANEIVRALNHMYDNLNMKCGECDYRQLCSEVDGLKTVHEAKNKNS